MTFTNPRDHISPLFKKLKLLTIDKIFILQCSKLLYQCRNSLVPNSISNLFSTPTHTHNTRYQRHNFSIPRFRNRYGRYSPTYICTTIWYNIPDDIKNLPYNQFKSAIIDILYHQ